MFVLILVCLFWCCCVGGVVDISIINYTSIGVDIGVNVKIDVDIDIYVSVKIEINIDINIDIDINICGAIGNDNAKMVLFLSLLLVLLSM